AALEQARSIQRQLAKDYHDEPGFSRDLGKTHNALAILYWLTKRPGKAKEAHLEALKWYGRALSRNPDRLDFQQELANAHNAFGTFWRGEDNQREAEAQFLKARDLFDLVNRVKPGVLECQQRRVWVAYNLGLVYKDTDRLEKAEQTFRDALRALTELG